MIHFAHIRSELKPLLRIAVPVILAELGWMSMGVVDTIMVSPLGPAAIGATGIGTSLHMAFAIFGMGLLLGLDTLVSQAYGAGRLDAAKRWLLHGLTLATLLTLPLMALAFALLLGIPRLGFHPEVMPLLRDYFGVVLWSTGPLLLYAALRRFLQGMHRVTPVMFALVSANVVNAAANWVLIYGHWGFPALGVTGAAWATLLSRLYMFGVLAMAVVGATRLKPGLSDDSLSRARALVRTVSIGQLRRLIELGFPAASQITLEVGVFAIATALAGRLDPVSSASHQIAMNIIAIVFMVPYGLASSGAVRVGHAVGADDPRRASGAGWATILLGSSFMLLAAVLLFAIPRSLIALFSQDTRVLTLGAALLVIAAIFQLFDGIQTLTTGVLRGLGDTRTPMIWNLAGHWFLGLPVGYTLCFVFGLGVVGLWIGLSIGLIFVGVILLFAWTKKVRAYASAAIHRRSEQTVASESYHAC